MFGIMGIRNRLQEIHVSRRTADIVRCGLSARLGDAGLTARTLDPAAQVRANAPPNSIVIQKEEALAGQVNVTVPLVVPSAYPALSAAHRSYESSEAGYKVAETQILFGTAQAFYAAAGADEIFQARHHGVEVAQKTLDDAQSRLAAGTVNPGVTLGDVMALVWAMRGLTETTGEVAPGTWQRFLDIHLAGLRAPGPLSATPSMSAGQLTELLPRP